MSFLDAMERWHFPGEYFRASSEHSTSKVFNRISPYRWLHAVLTCCSDEGMALDLDCDGDGTPTTNSQVFHWIMVNVPFTQLIWEFGDERNPAWVHVSFEKGNIKREVLRALKGGKYIPFDL
jgi:hypothetical protein